ncbi:heme/hemin ABC transporter substrate-binding protein [Halomonas halocynthiae]|uniref:heme/hemin ABC transporter substrate-binding protein n=1 Tax=Halomonas halocynthiae TaxID=176290 RepID=UPI00041AF77A|nr:ABC transporter substrate-binding protein [Halomonas halocynthiae]
MPHRAISPQLRAMTTKKPRPVLAIAFTALLSLYLLTIANTTAASTAFSNSHTPRLLVLGGDVAEIVAELGAADQLIARDDTVTFPPTLTELPSVGYLRNLSGESVLGLKPDKIIASHAAGPKEVLAQVEASGVTLTHIQLPRAQRPSEPPSMQAELNSKIRQIATAIQRDSQGEVLIDRLLPKHHQVAALPELRGLNVMFLLHHGGMTPMVSGRDTSADRVINLLGANNAFADFNGYKPVSAEGLVPAAPEVVIIPETGLNALGGEQGLWQLPGLALTPAGNAKHYVTVDSVALLGVTPRTPQALLDLHRALSDIHHSEAP